MLLKEKNAEYYGRYEIDINGLPGGTYIMTLTTNGKQFVKTVTKK